jgi:predicted phage terminase large subunit-like protein
MKITEVQKMELLKKMHNDIEYFAKVVVPHHVTSATPEFHREIFKLLNNDKNKKMAVIAPREHAKSTISNLIFLLHRVLFRKEKFCVIVSESFGQSVLFLDAIKRELEVNETIKVLFGNLQSEKWSESDIVTSTDIRITCRGSGQRMRGMKYRQYRPTLVILDDFESEANTETQEQRNKLFRWINGVVLPGLDRDGRILLIGTIVHNDSYLNHIRKIGPTTGWKVLYYQAELNPEIKEALWEERISWEELQNKKAEYAAQGLIDLYWMEYMNIAQDPEGRPFTQDMIQYYTGTLERNDQGWWIRTDDTYEPVNVYMGLDPSLGKANGDFTVFVVTAITQNGDIYVYRIDRDRINPVEIVDKMFDHNKMFPGVLQVVETTAFQESLVHFAREKMRASKQFIPIKEVKPRMRKSDRLLKLQPYFASKKVYLRREHSALIGELLEFPKGSNDDVMDALWNSLEFKTNADNRKFKKGFKKLTQRKYNWASL